MSDRGKKKNSNSFLVQGGILAVAGIISRLIGVVYRIPLLNIMTVRGQGFYEVAFQIYQIALLLTSYSLPLAVSKLVAARVANNERRNAHKVFKTAMTFAFCVGMIAALITFFGADFIAAKVMNLRLSSYALRVLAPGLVLVAVMGVMRGYFQGLGTMIPTAVSQILEQLVNAVVSLVGAGFLMGRGEVAAKKQGDELLGAAYAAAGGTLGTLIGAVIGLIFLLFIFYSYKNRLKRQLRSDRSAHRESYRFILRVILLTVAPVILSSAVYNLQNVLDNAIFSNIMIAQGSTESDCALLVGKIGQYYTLFSVPLAVANALASSLIPSLIAAVESRERRRVHQKIFTVVRVTMLIAIPSAMGFFILARPIMDLLFKTDNEVQAMMLRLGAISVVFYCLSTVTSAVLQGLNRMMAPVKNATVSLVIHLMSLFLMLVVFKWGVYAVILSKVIFSIVMCIMNAHDIRETADYVQEQRKSFLIPAIAALIMGIVTFMAHLVFDIFIGGFIATTLSIILAALVYGISLLMLGGLSEDDILGMPKGATMVTVFRKLHLLREEYY